LLQVFFPVTSLSFPRGCGERCTVPRGVLRPHVLLQVITFPRLVPLPFLPGIRFLRCLRTFFLLGRACPGFTRRLPDDAPFSSRRRLSFFLLKKLPFLLHFLFFFFGIEVSPFTTTSRVKASLSIHRGKLEAVSQGLTFSSSFFLRVR